MPRKACANVSAILLHDLLLLSSSARFCLIHVPCYAESQAEGPRVSIKCY